LRWFIFWSKSGVAERRHLTIGPGMPTFGRGLVTFPRVPTP
jgi:hypothetical protein